MKAKQPPEQTLFKSSHVQLCVHERIPSWVFDASLTPTLLRMDQKANIFWLQSASKVQSCKSTIGEDRLRFKEAFIE